MALSTLRLALRPGILSKQTSLVRQCYPMGTSAHEQMDNFWKKNEKLNRPSSPWIIYKPHLPMMTSLTHRVTGVVMGVALCGISVGTFVAPGDFQSYIELIKSMEISPAIMFPAKTAVAFPLVYHYINGIRHLSWDYGKGYELSTQYKTGWTIVSSALAISAFFASMSYWM